MAENRGKQFEQHIQEAFEKVPDVSITRLHDQTTGFKGSSNICDFIAYRKPNEFYIECKSCHGNTFPLSNVTDTQWKGLVEKSLIPGICAGVLIWWVDKDVTIFFTIEYLEYAKNVKGFKSIRFDDAENGWVVEGKKKRVFFDYDIKSFLDEVQKWIE